MRALAFLLVLALCGCTTAFSLKHGIYYGSLLQKKGGEFEYNPKTGALEAKYNTDSDPAVQVFKAGAEVYGMGIAAKAAEGAVGTIAEGVE